MPKNANLQTLRDLTQDLCSTADEQCGRCDKLFYHNGAKNVLSELKCVIAELKVAQSECIALKAEVVDLKQQIQTIKNGE